MLLLICSYARSGGGKQAGEVFKCSECHVYFLNRNVFPYRAGLFCSGFLAGPWELELAQLS